MLADVQSSKHQWDDCSCLSLFLSECPSFTNKICGERFFFSPVSWMSQLCCCHLWFLEIVSSCPDALWILPGSSLSLKQSEKNKAPKRESGTWINNLEPHDSAPIFRSLLFFWGFEKGLRIVYTWSDVCLMQHRFFSVSFDLTPVKSGQPIWLICIMQFLLDLLGNRGAYPREKFFASYQAKWGFFEH